MQRIFHLPKNNLILLGFFISLVINVSLIPLSSYAVSADLKLEITGIQCDLQALYGNNDPATVIVPPYCDNAPETPPITPVTPPISPVQPPNTSNTPLRPSLTALLYKPLPGAPRVNIAPKPALSRDSLPEVDRNKTSLVAKSAVDAVIATLLVAIIFVVFILSPWLSKLHK